MGSLKLKEALQGGGLAMADEIGEEITDQAGAIFDALDGDGNGELTGPELCNRLSDFGFDDEEVQRIFLGLDANADNKVTREEFSIGFPTVFCKNVDDYFVGMLAGEDQFEDE